MKNYFAIAALVLTVFAGCSKFETADPENNSEISYKVMNLNMSTKASSFTGTFNSWAYYLASGSFDYSAGDLYIEKALIENVSGVWKNAATSFYWPKTGTLTFFACTPATVNASCDATTGVTATITSSNTVAENNALDFMVAAIASDKNANVNTYGQEGVPTLFGHKLTKVGVKVKKESDQTGVSIKVNSITMSTVNNKGSYTQNGESWVLDGSSNANYIFLNTPTVLSTAFANGESSFYMIPQVCANMGSAKIVVNYTITYQGTGTNTIVETYDSSYTLSTSGTPWGINKDICYNISISGPDEILWDPAVEDWDTTSNVGVTL